MRILEAIRSGLEALTVNTLRTGLTLLGVIIGVSAVITLMSVGLGAQKGITERIEGLGSNLVFVRPNLAQNRVTSAARGALLTDADATMLKDRTRFPYIEAVVPQLTLGASATYEATSFPTIVVGTTPDYLGVRRGTLAAGRFISEDDVRRRRLSVVLGANVARELFGDKNPIGERVRVGRRRLGFSMEVVGVMAPRGGVDSSDDDLVFFPLPTFQSRIAFLRNPSGEFFVNQLNIQLVDGTPMAEAKEDIALALAQRHNTDPQSYLVQSQEDLLATAANVSRTLTILLGSIAGISLLVGGIGIMNIMLVNVTERTREIGLRKALGATRSDILWQFLSEAVAVSLAGGLIGVLTGVVLANLLNGRTIADEELTTVVTPLSVILAAGVAVAVGIFFGFYPAHRASRQNPIDALRYE